MIQAPPTPYPVSFSADYPERQSRWKALLRLILVVPALLFVAIATYGWYLSLLPTWIAILIRGRVPRWLFDFHIGFLGFYYRTIGYFSLLTDNYPAFDGPYPIRLDVFFPERVSRWQVLLWKTATIIPHAIGLSLLWTAAMAIAAVGWISILFSGQFPKGLHGFVAGVLRWQARVAAYWLSLTDDFPPYSTDAEAPAAQGASRIASSVIGSLAIAGMVAGVVLAIIFVPWTGEDKVTQVSYERLTSDQAAFSSTSIEVNALQLDLLSATDPADEFLELIAPRTGHRLILFSFFLANLSSDSTKTISAADFRLSNVSEDDREPILMFIGRRAPPVRIGSGEFLGADIVFEIPTNSDPLELRYGGGFLEDRAVFEFQ